MHGHGRQTLTICFLLICLIHSLPLLKPDSEREQNPLVPFPALNSMKQGQDPFITGGNVPRRQRIQASVGGKGASWRSYLTGMGDDTKMTEPVIPEGVSWSEILNYGESDIPTARDIQPLPEQEGSNGFVGFAGTVTSLDSGGAQNCHKFAKSFPSTPPTMFDLEFQQNTGAITTACTSKSSPFKSCQCCVWEFCGEAVHAIFVSLSEQPWRKHELFRAIGEGNTCCTQTCHTSCKLELKKI